MKIDESLRGPYQRIRDVAERFARGEESARDMANYYVCKHNLYMALANQQEDPWIRKRLRNKAGRAIIALDKYDLMTLARKESETVLKTA